MYKLVNNKIGDTAGVCVIGEQIFIPFDNDNTDYQQYLKWLEEGNTPEPADEAPKE